MDEAAKTGMREVLIAERARLFTAVNTLGNVQWLGTGGLLAACLGVLSFAAGPDSSSAPVITLFGTFERLMGLAFLIGVFIVGGAAALNIYMEFAIHQHLLRIHRAGVLLGLIEGQPTLLVDDDLKLHEKWSVQRTGLAVLLIVVTSVIMGSLLWGVLSRFWHTYGWIQALVSYYGSTWFCASLIGYRFYFVGEMEKGSEVILAELKAGIK